MCGIDSTGLVVSVTDTIKPVIYCPTDITAATDSGNCINGTVILSQPSANDACGIDSLYNNAPGIYPIGTTTVIWTVVDNNGNVSTCEQDVTIVDSTAPVITCAPNMTVGTDANSCNASNVFLTPPTATDACGIDTVYNNAPASFPLGNTTVTWTATDNNGISSTCNQIVTAVDSVKPSISCGPDLTISTDNGLCSANSVVLATPTGTDNCTSTVTFTSNAPASYVVGTTQVIWTGSDGNGNSSTCTQNVTVIDTTAPTIVCPSNITLNADNGICIAKGVNLGTPTVSDNCTTSVSNNAPSSYPVGVTNVVWTATDNSNNSSSCTQTVTVLDNQVPNATCKNHTVTLVNGTATISVNDINNGSSDNCGIDTMYLSQSTFTSAHIGNNTVTLTVVDVNGNSSTCTGVVTVQGGGNNNMSCSISVTPANNTYTGGNPNNIYIGYGPQGVTLTANVSGGAGGYTYSWTGNSLSCNNCSVVSVVPSTAGTYVFTLTVTDINNNTTTCYASICVQDIRVPGKNNNKVYICHNGKTQNISVNAVAAHLNNHNDFLGKCDDEGCNASSKGGDNNEEEILIGLQEVANGIDEFKLFPNPNDGTFRLEIREDFTGGYLTVMDMLGKVVKRIQIDKNSSLSFSMPEIADGVYMVEVRYNDNLYRKRMVIKR